MKISVLTGALALSALGSSALGGTLIIDDFTSSPIGIYPVVGDAQMSTVYSAFEYLPDVYRGVRAISLTRGFDSADSAFGDVTLDIGNGGTPGASRLKVDSPEGYSPQLLLFYGFVPPGPDTEPLDFSGYESLQFDFSSFSAPLGGQLSVRIEIYDNFGEVTAATRYLDATGGPGSVSIDLASLLDPDYPVTLSNIDDFVVQINAPQGASFELDRVWAVPAPSSLLVIAPGLLALRRRR